MWAVDESPAEKAKHERAVELLSVQPENLVVSTQVLQEFYVVTTRKLKNPLSEERAARAVRGIAKLDVVGVDATWVRLFCSGHGCGSGRCPWCAWHGWCGSAPCGGLG